MGKDSTKGSAQTGEVPAGDSSIKTGIACKTCGNMYRNNHAFAGHKGYCKSTKKPKKNVIELANDQHADEIVDRNSEEVTSKSGSQLTETDCDSTTSLAVTSLELNAEGQAGASPIGKNRIASWGSNWMDRFGSANYRRDLEPEQKALKLAQDQSTGKMADRNYRRDFELNAEGQAGASPIGKNRIASWGSNWMDRFGSASYRRDLEPEQKALKLAQDQSTGQMADRNSEEVTSKSGGVMTETDSDSTRSLAVTTPAKDCKFTDGLELNADGQAGASPARKFRNRYSCGRNLMDIFGSISDNSTKEPEQNARKLAEDQSTGNMTDRNSEEVTSKSDSEWTEEERETVEMLRNSVRIFTDDEKEQLSSTSLVPNGQQQNAEGQATSQGHQGTKQNAIELAEDQIVAENSEEVTAKLDSQLTEAEWVAVEVLTMLRNSVRSFTDDEKERLSSRSLAATSLEKDYTFTSGPEQNGEGQAGASPAVKIRQCDSCGRKFRGIHAFAGHKSYCKDTQEHRKML